MNDVLFLPTTTSTNDAIRTLEPDEPFFAVAAFEQTGGRGSKGREFFSPYGGLYLSVSAEIDNGLLPVLTPLAAVAVLRAVKKVFSVDLGVKWVNDLVYKDNGKKVCGILTESRTEGVCRAVIGIGVNVFRSQVGYGGYEDVVGYLVDASVDEEVLKVFAKEIFGSIRYLLLHPDEGMAEYAEHSVLTGKKVRFKNDRFDGEYLVRGVDKTGRILLEKDGEIVACNDGEVIAWQR